jgi:hypothetical protein
MLMMLFRQRFYIWQAMLAQFGIPNDSLGGCSVWLSDRPLLRGKKIVFDVRHLAILPPQWKIHLIN